MKRILVSLITIALSIGLISTLESTPAISQEYIPSIDIAVWHPLYELNDNVGLGQYATGLLPGQIYTYDTKIKNKTQGDYQVTLSFTLSSLTLNSLGSDSNFLRVRLTDLTQNVSSPWYTLREILVSDRIYPELPPLGQEITHDYRLEFEIDQYAPETLSNFTANDLLITIFGTDVNDTSRVDEAMISEFGFTTASFTPVLPPTPTSTPTLAPTPTPEPTVTPGETDPKGWLVFVPLCSSKPTQYRYWKVYNLSRNPLTYTWTVSKINQSGTGSVASRDYEYLKVPAYSGMNATKFSWNNHQITLVSFALKCSIDFQK